MSTTIGTIYHTNLAGKRSAILTHGPMFCPHTLEHLAHSAARYQRDTEGAEALVWASAIAIFEWNKAAA